MKKSELKKLIREVINEGQSKIKTFKQIRNYVVKTLKVEDIDDILYLDRQKTINKYRLLPEERSSTIIASGGNNFVVTSSGDNLLWDYGGDGEYSFSYIGEYTKRRIGDRVYKITYQGEGSFLFDINKMI